MRKPGSCADLIGSGGYYGGRHDDFAARHPELVPPPYYLEYGLKYFLRFQELRAVLSDAGKGWVDRTAHILQRLIEDELVENDAAFDALEMDHNAFHHFAYGTHPQAYVEGGLGELPAEDILVIVNTPDAADLLDHDGLSQIVRTALAVVTRNGALRNVALVDDAVLTIGRHFAARVTRKLQIFGHEAIQVVQAGEVGAGIVVGQIRMLARSPSWVMQQRWDSPLFCSWRLPAAVVRRFVPEELDLDLDDDDDAWISLVPLQMMNVGLSRPNLPRLPPFPEVNLRTYVRHRGTPGVYFLSLECGQLMVDIGAKLFFNSLPYRPAQVSIARQGDSFECESTRGRDALLHCRYRPLGAPKEAEQGSLDQFLTERYTMFIVDPRTRHVRRGDVHHAPWKLQPASVQMITNTIPRSFGLPIDGPPDHVGFSPGVDTDTIPFTVVQ